MELKHHLHLEIQKHLMEILELMVTELHQLLEDFGLLVVEVVVQILHLQEVVEKVDLEEVVKAEE